MTDNNNPDAARPPRGTAIAAPLAGGADRGRAGAFALALLAGLGAADAYAQEALPEIDVAAPTPSRAPPRPAPAPTAAAPEAPNAARELDRKVEALDRARDELLPKIGASSYTISREAIETLPQGDNTPIDKVILQAPGVSYDSAVSNPSFHVRNEYANVQYRINGLVLPEGVSGLGPVLDTSFVGSLSLLTGALPAQYGLRTAGVIDITSRAFSTPAGSVGVYGGSRETITTSFDYGGAVGDTQYFTTLRGNWNALGIENTTPSFNAVHDHTEQGKFFGYVSTLLGDSTRLSLISGASTSKFQIPNNPGQTPLGDFGPAVYPSSALNENEVDTYVYNMLALQTKVDKFDAQFAVFQRHASIHFIPDIFGDLVFNDVASDVTRESDLYGAQFDGSYRIDDAHKLRAGFAVTAERTNVTNTSTVLPVDPVTGAIAPTPFPITDFNAKTGWNIGGYVQHEWKITDKLVLNAGAALRSALSIRRRQSAQSAPRRRLQTLRGDKHSRGIFALFHAADAGAGDSHQSRAVQQHDQSAGGAVQQSGDAGTRALFRCRRRSKIAAGPYGGPRRLFEDRQQSDRRRSVRSGGGADPVQLGEGFSQGVEFKSAYQNGDFKAYGNLAVGISRAKDAVSNQYLLDATEYTYLLTNYHNTDDSQFMTGSAGASYKWDKTLLSVSATYGSGLRSGFANMDHVPAYLNVNLGSSREFELISAEKPLTLRFDIVNLFDRIYELRSGTGIGVFAPQYGARRGFFVGLSQKL